MKSLQSTQTTLTQGDAHAWVEVYVDGVGWMPVEVTPTYYSAIYSADQVIEVPREVAGNGADDAALGTVNDTGDSLDTQDSSTIDIGAGATVAGCVFVCAILLVLFVAEAQRFVRIIKRRQRCIQGMAHPHVEFTRWLYAYLIRLMQQAGIVTDFTRPLDTMEEQRAQEVGFLPGETDRLIALFQACLFGGDTLQVAHVRMVLLGAVILEDSNKKTAPLLGRLRHRYIDAYGGKIGLGL